MVAGDLRARRYRPVAFRRLFYFRSAERIGAAHLKIQPIGVTASHQTVVVLML